MRCVELDLTAQKGEQMRISWFDKEHRKRTCSIASIDDIQAYDTGESFCLRIRSDLVLCGGILGEFLSPEARDKAYNDIKAALEAGVEEFDYRSSFYSR